MSEQELPNELSVKAWMNAPDHTIGPDAMAEEAFAIMQRADIRHLLVMKDEELLGVVTDRDLRRPKSEGGEVMSVSELYRLGEDLTVEEIMTSPPFTASPDDSTAQAARVMVENKFNCLPVLNGDKVVGILTSSDLLAALVYSSDPDFADLPAD
jgi:acetoin utilization protein AcuB